MATIAYPTTMRDATVEITDLRAENERLRAALLKIMNSNLHQTVGDLDVKLVACHALGLDSN